MVFVCVENLVSNAVAGLLGSWEEMEAEEEEEEEGVFGFEMVVGESKGRGLCKYKEGVCSRKLHVP